MAESADRVAIAFDPAQIRKAQDRNPFVKISDIVYDILSEAILSSTIALQPPAADQLISFAPSNPQNLACFVDSHKKREFFERFHTAHYSTPPANITPR